MTTDQSVTSLITATHSSWHDVSNSSCSVTRPCTHSPPLSVSLPVCPPVRVAVTVCVCVCVVFLLCLQVSSLSARDCPVRLSLTWSLIVCLLHVLTDHHAECTRFTPQCTVSVIGTRGSAMAEGPRDALVSRNSATTKYPYRMALFA